MPLLELIVCIINPRDLIAPPLMTKCSLTFRRRGQDEELKDQDFYQKFKRKRGLLFQQKKLKMKLKGLLCEFFEVNDYKINAYKLSVQLWLNS